jgi:hypothetical protein
MTDLFKTLLHDYGILYVSLSKLESERPGNPYESLNAYYESIGGIPYETTAGAVREIVAALEPGEPSLVVRISSDGSTHIRRFEGNEIEPRTEGEATSRVLLLELPEDEFYFFKAFRQGLFDLEKQVPAFLLQMAFVYAYSLFECYVAEILRLRLMAHPQQVGLSKQIEYGEVFASASREELIALLIDREVSRLMYEPIDSLLNRMRGNFGFRDVSREHDEAIQRLSLTRNCLLHNAGKANDKLAKAVPTIAAGQPIAIQVSSVSEAIHTFRKCCVQIDKAYESLV